MLLGSISGVRATGRFDAYAAALAPAHREILVSLVAGTWVPLDVAWAHYEACDTLNYTAEQGLANGRSTFDNTSVTLLGTILRMGKEAGVSPWNVLPHLQRFWDRAYDGGGLRVVKTGPKEARVDVAQIRFAESRYYRNALRGVLTGILELFCQKAYVTERPGSRAPGTVVMRVQWA